MSCCSKILGLLMVLALSLVACTGETAVPTPQATEKPESTAASTETPIKVTSEPPTATATREAGGLMCIIVPGVENPFFGTMQEIAAQKAEELGYEALELVHDDDAIKEGELIDSCISQEAVAIILNPADRGASIANVQKAADAGIPVFLIDRDITQGDIAISQIVSNNYQGATLVAEEFVRLMEGTGDYVVLTGRDFDYMVLRRFRVFLEIIDNYPDMKMVAQETANWSQSEAYDVMEALISMFPDIKGVICENDTMALGAQAALDAAGLGDDVIVAGFDGFDDVNQSIMASKIDVSVLHPVAELASQAVIQADQYIRTGSTGMPERQVIDMVLLTIENACQYTGFAPNGKTSCP